MRTSKAKKKNSTRRWLETLLLLGGVIGIGAWVGSNAAPAVWQDWQNWVFDRETAGETTHIGDYLVAVKERALRSLETRVGQPVSSEPLVASRPTVSLQTKRSLKTDDLIGRLSIPRLHLRAIVREGVGRGTLGVALGHIPGTALPGQDGNMAVAGHRDTLFRCLHAIKPHDLIRFETLHNRYDYEVVSTEIVPPQNVGVLKANSYSELTLVTCYPFDYIGPAPDRFIVKAREVPLSAEAEAPAEIVPVVADDRPRPTVASPRRIYFSVETHHSRQLAPGISIGISETNADGQLVNGWMWLMPDRRTLWIRNQTTRDPIVFYGYQDGRRREVVITHVTEDSAMGYLQLSE